MLRTYDGSEKRKKANVILVRVKCMSFPWRSILLSSFRSGYFSHRRGCPRVQNFCMGILNTKEIWFEVREEEKMGKPPTLGLKLNYYTFWIFLDIPLDHFLFKWTKWGINLFHRNKWITDEHVLLYYFS